jgi:hypothetical protein
MGALVISVAGRGSAELGSLEVPLTTNAVVGVEKSHLELEKRVGKLNVSQDERFVLSRHSRKEWPG